MLSFHYVYKNNAMPWLLSETYYYYVIIKCLSYRWYISRGKKFREFHVIEQIIHRKQKKIYMVHILLLTDSQNFNPVKNTPYMVLLHCDTNVSAATIFLFYLNFIIIILCAGEFLQKCFLPFICNLKISLHMIH